MRLGILLILLQSMLLCAEGRAESQVLQLDSTRKFVHMLLQSGGPQLQQQEQEEDSGSAAVAPPPPRIAWTALAAPVVAPFSPPSSAARAAHAIRAPPARQ